jgi:3-methyladenine DNA glycosylase/8-oxoguanine DNA glycosylase
VWRATRTPEGPATVRITAGADGRLAMQAWGAGAAWALEAFPALVGDTDDDSSFAPLDPVVADLRRRLGGLRLCRTGAVVEALVPAILEQKVIGAEARRSYALIVRSLGEPAPGPGGLYVLPTPETLARTPSYVFHRFGVERKRADTIRTACSYAHRLEETTAMALPDAYARLRALPGVGAWTAAEVALIALGDPDAVSVGDYHLPHHVAFALAGEPRADDARMLELLAPYAGQRGRVIRMISAGSPAPPRFGPRLPLQRIAAL